MPRQPYSAAVQSDGEERFPLLPWGEKTEMRGGAFLNGKEGRVGYRKLFFSKAFSKYFSLLIPLYHALSLFLPEKFLLPFLAILRKELQQRHFWSENHRWCIIINTKAKAFSWLETFLSNEYLDFSIIYHIHRLHTSKFLPMAKLAPNPYQSP